MCTIWSLLYLIVCNLCENTEGLLYIGLVFRCQKAVVLQDADLCVSSCCQRLQLLQQFLSRSHGKLLGLLLLCGVPDERQM